ncbi:MAG: dihydrodipicolinate reductase [Saprospiraceae bacterium]|nr:MAG: dihydrodipicolinate reductase [Saprospiraceae bacterium]
MNILQIGLGPLGLKIANFIAERPGLTTSAAVDKNPNLFGKDLGELAGGKPSGVAVASSISAAVVKNKPDVAVLTTVSDMASITPQIEEILAHGIPIVSTCEELSFPWEAASELAMRIDAAAKAAGVAVLGTGINPGFLMDALPTFLTAVCQDVKTVTVKRYQNAQFRRIPFQKKIGAGLALEQFEHKKQDGSLRHVGLTQSMQLIARRMGWKLDKTEDIISPVVAKNEIVTDAMTIPAGYATGVRQIGNGYVNGVVKIKLEFQASIGEPESYDEVIIDGTPRIQSKIAGGVNGDVATCAITLNAIPQVLRSTPGLKTMVDVAPVSFYS